MKILVCPDKFKGTLTARGATDAIVRALRRKYPAADITGQPLADGGEGSLDLIARRHPNARRRLSVTGPLRRPVTATYILDGNRAWIESSEACGLRHCPVPRRDPSLTTTIGVGQLIEDAVARGAKHIILFLGGSATNDGGAGMAGALGYRFFSHRPDDFIPTGESLIYVRRIDAAEVLPGLREVSFTVASDVKNPLLGPDGATHTYGPQKGATAEQLSLIETGMAHFAKRMSEDLGRDVAAIPGSGAAGGLGAGALAFLNAEIVPAADYLLDAVGLTVKAFAQYDLVVTGEGSIDEQTPSGKLVSCVAVRAKQAGVARTIALCGRNALPAKTASELGLTAIYALTDHPEISLTDATQAPNESLEKLVARML